MIITKRQTRISDELADPYHARCGRAHHNVYWSRFMQNKRLWTKDQRVDVYKMSLH